MRSDVVNQIHPVGSSIILVAQVDFGIHVSPVIIKGTYGLDVLFYLGEIKRVPRLGVCFFPEFHLGKRKLPLYNNVTHQVLLTLVYYHDNIQLRPLCCCLNPACHAGIQEALTSVDVPYSADIGLELIIIKSTFTYKPPGGLGRHVFFEFRIRYMLVTFKTYRFYPLDYTFLDDIDKNGLARIRVGVYFIVDLHIAVSLLNVIVAYGGDILLNKIEVQEVSLFNNYLFGEAPAFYTGVSSELYFLYQGFLNNCDNNDYAFGPVLRLYENIREIPCCIKTFYFLV